MRTLYMKKWKQIVVGIIIVVGTFLSVPGITVNAEENSTPAGEVKTVERINQFNVAETVAPKVTNADLEGKIERGGSQIYGLVQTVVIYASYIGFAIGILWTMIGFGRSGRTGGLWLLLTSSIAFLLIGYGPEAVSFLGEWFKSL